MQMADLGIDVAASHDSTNQILRGAHIIGFADMPQSAYIHLLPLSLAFKDEVGALGGRISIFSMTC